MKNITKALLASCALLSAVAQASEFTVRFTAQGVTPQMASLPTPEPTPEPEPEPEPTPEPELPPVVLPDSCQDFPEANGSYTIYPSGSVDSAVTVECVTFENGTWQKLARIYANKNTKTALSHNVAFQEAMVVHESYWISAYSDHRKSSQNNYVAINGVEYNPDVGVTKYANLGSKAVWVINYGNEGRYKGWQVSDDTGYFYANIYVR